MKNIPNNEIWYTTSDNSITNNFDAYAFGSQLLSNTYKDGICKLKFSNDITVIGESAFALNEDIETIILPNSITKIDVGAFSACQGLQEIYIPNSVVEIGECAFGLCVNLMKFSGKFATKDGLCLIVNGIINQFALGNEMHEYSIPTEVSEIGWSSFSDSTLKKVILHENITKIGHSAFCGCENLEEINIPNSVTTIEDAAFQDCVNLKSCFIPKSVLNLGVNVFDGCNDISIIYEDSSKDETENNDLDSLLKKYAEVINVKSNEWKYSGDSSATFVRVPDGVEVITSDAFEACEDVETIYIPSSVKDVDAWAFSDLENLCRFESKYTSEDGKCLIINNTLVGFAGKNLFEYKLPNGITNIAPQAFRCNNYLCSIDIPNGVRTIGYQAFFMCKNLKTVKFPNSLHLIAESAFYNCSSLKKINIPQSVKIIGESAFSECKYLEEITFPDNLAKTKGNIFSGCTNLKNISSQLISNDGRSLVIDGILISYIETTPIDEYRIPNNIKEVAKCAFFGNRSIVKIYIPQSVTKIGSSAFQGCDKLIAVEFESDIPPRFGYASFYGNSSRLVIYVPMGTISKYKKALKEANMDDVLVLDKTKNEDVFHEIVYGNAYDKRISNEKLLSIGISYEREGNEEASISVYEKLVNRKYNDDYPYRELISIYKKRKDVENEIRILSLAMKYLPNRGNSHHKYRTRYERLSSASQNAIYPTKVDIPKIDVKKGDLYEDAILKLPEFNFYYKGYGIIPRTTASQDKTIIDINEYFKTIIDDAEVAYAKKDYTTATVLYERVIQENYWKTDIWDKLIKLYSKAELYDDEIRVLRQGIKHFSQLRDKRLEYVTKLAQKYNALDFLNQRINSGGKIQYYMGRFDLYNPYSIVEKWKERLEKKLKWKEHLSKKSR